MKKLASLLPIAAMIAVTIFGYQAFSTGRLGGPQFVILSAAAMVLLGFVFRPKQAFAKPNPAAVTKALGDYARNAFKDDRKESQLFQSAVQDYGKNMPKSALNKLNKLAPQCSTNEEKYAVAMISALCLEQNRDYEAVIREYNRAVILNPTSELAYTIGTHQQRIGELKKARESYDFALELDPNNINARASMATAYVASHKYEQALEQAMQALDMDENCASALATAAICHGIGDNNMMYTHYTKRAVENGYSEEKIKQTVKALKK